MTGGAGRAARADAAHGFAVKADASGIRDECLSSKRCQQLRLTVAGNARDPKDLAGAHAEAYSLNRRSERMLRAEAQSFDHKPFGTSASRSAHAGAVLKSSRVAARSSP